MRVVGRTDTATNTNGRRSPHRASFRVCQDIGPDADRTETDQLIVDPKDPLSIARAFLNWNFLDEGNPTLYHWQGEFRLYNGAYYSLVDYDEIRARLYKFLDHALIRTKTTIEGKQVDVLVGF